MTPEDRRWLKSGDPLWSNFHRKETNRRGVFWLFAGLILFIVAAVAGLRGRFFT
jgi:hypothetical protein